MEEELLDTFDINGNFLGIKTRSFCHSENPGVYHKAVWIWIVNDKNQCLVQKRSPKKKKSPNKYDMPSAGHVDAGEIPINCCVRETKEELGINTKPSDYKFLTQWTNTRGFELAQVYLLKTTAKIDDFVLQEDEVSEVRYLQYPEFIKLLYSDKFCAHDKAYKDYISQVLYEEIQKNAL